MQSKAFTHQHLSLASHKLLQLVEYSDEQASDVAPFLLDQSNNVLQEDLAQQCRCSQSSLLHARLISLERVRFKQLIQDREQHPLENCRQD